MINSFFYLFFFTFLSLISVYGYSKTFIYLFKIENKIFSNFRIIEFFLVLFFLGFILIIISFFSSINDYLSYIFYFFGSILYFIYFFKIKNKSKEFQFNIIILFIAVFFALFSIYNDDFDYHYRLIDIFKNNANPKDLLSSINNLPDYSNYEEWLTIRTAINSHLLLIHSLFLIQSFPETLFCLTSLIYSISLYDFFQNYKRNKKINLNTALFYNLFVFIFLLSVINTYKEYGMDLPGQIIILIIFSVFFEYENSFKNKNFSVFIFIILLSLAVFAITIKITNILIILLLLLIFFHTSKKMLTLLFSIIVSIPLLIWMMQNYIISKCLIWPISFLCFANHDLAEYTKNNYEAFTKSVLNLEFSQHQILYYLSDFNWIPFWLNSHLSKILEIHFIYFIVLFIPIIIFFFRKKMYFKNFQFQNNYYLLYNSKNYIFIYYIIISIISVVIWFIFFPAYRFGVAYNFNFSIIVLIPLWKIIYYNNVKFFDNAIRLLILVSCIFFIYNNIEKIHNYIDRYGGQWPQNQLILLN